MRGFDLKNANEVTKLKTRNMVMLQFEHVFLYETNN